MTKTVVPFLPDASKPSLLINVPRRKSECSASTKSFSCIPTRRANRTHSSTSLLPIPKPRAAASTCNNRSFATVLRMFHQKNRADDFALALRNPAALAPRVELLDEIRHNLRRQRLILLVPRHIPARITGPAGSPPSPYRPADAGAKYTARFPTARGASTDSISSIAVTSRRCSALRHASQSRRHILIRPPVQRRDRFSSRAPSTTAASLVRPPRTVLHGSTFPS